MRKWLISVTLALVLVLALPFLPVEAEQEDMDRVEALNQQVIELYQQGRYAQAIDKAREVLAITEKALGPDHVDVANSLNNLALLYEYVGDYASAEPLYRRALAIREKALGPDHPGLATYLNNLALLYDSTGEYAKAEPLYIRALAIKEKAYSPEHPETAISLSNLALLYHHMGDLGRAEPLYVRALAINEKALGPEHPDTAVVVNNLGLLYVSLGDYGRAEPLYARALAIKEKVLGPEHPQTATSLDNLAVLYVNMGSYDLALPLLTRALVIREKALGPDHPDVAVSLDNLAGLLRDLEQYAKAEPLYARALAIREKTPGPDHPDTAVSLNNLALLYHRMGEYAKAEPLYFRALAINEKALGPHHPNTARFLNNLAGLYTDMGDYDKAEPLYTRALAAAQKTWGPDHPHAIFCRTNLGVLRAARGDLQSAHRVFMEAQEEQTRLIDQVLGYTSEDRKLMFLSTIRFQLEMALSLAAEDKAPDVVKDTLNIWLKRKGIILEAQKRYQEALVYADDVEAMKIFRELARVRSRLSQLVFAGPGEEGPEDYLNKMDELNGQKERLEAGLSRISRAYARDRKAGRADADQVAAALPEKSVLIEFARVSICNFKAKGREEQWQPAHYLAFVLPAGNKAKPVLVDLGEAKPIDRAVSDFKQAVTDTEDIRGLGASTAARGLHDRVFARLKPELGGAREIFISPDGDLSLIPFEVLKGPDGRFLIEDYTFNYLSAGRDLIGFGDPAGETGKALILGDPDFDLETSDKGQSREGQQTRAAGLYFDRLPGTRMEVEAIREIVGLDQSELYTGPEAVEAVLFRLDKAPRILHLATHGFFLQDPDRPLPKDTRGLDFKGRHTRASSSWLDNPLLRSGLVLAGANHGTGGTNTNDGLLTAEKVLGLNLRGTRLVVLSACDTGAGEVKAGEGVYGLRRAFVQAGARGLVMSLWPVPDRETQELMVRFYENIRSGKMNRCQALRQAVLEQKEIAQKRYNGDNPLFWGAFVFLGEP